MSCREVLLCSRGRNPRAGLRRGSTLMLDDTPDNVVDKSFMNYKPLRAKLDKLNTVFMLSKLPARAVVYADIDNRAFIETTLTVNGARTALKSAGVTAYLAAHAMDSGVVFLNYRELLAIYDRDASRIDTFKFITATEAMSDNWNNLKCFIFDMKSDIFNLLSRVE